MRVVRGPVPVDAGGEEPDPEGRIVVDETQRRRSRFRTRTSAGEEVGVVVDAAGVLSAGDVLETDDGERFVVELETTEALVVAFGDERETDPAAMVVAGHAVGNRHWDLVAREGKVYVPTGGDSEGRRAFLEPYLPAEASVRVESVDPSLFDESRTGHGDGVGGHSHGHVDEYSYDHDDEHSHGHEHDDEHGHGHEHDDDTHDDTRPTQTRSAGGDG